MKPFELLEHSEHPVFQLLLKGCTIEAPVLHEIVVTNTVSVVVERMYD